MKPIYIVSGDLEILLRSWLQSLGTTREVDFVHFRRHLHEALSFADHEVRWVEADQIANGMAAFLRNETRPVISIDPVYAPSPHMLHVTRCVDDQLESLEGIHQRPGHPPVQQQIDVLARAIGAPCDVVLVDDVVFTGSVIQKVIEQLSQVGLTVRRVVSGITIRLEDHPDPYARCEALGASLDSVMIFPTNGESVVDEICERDFCVFAPMTGRTVRNGDGNWGASYLHPFGRPESWASMGHHAVAVSRRILELNLELLDHIEALVGRHITFQDLQRQPWGVRHHAVEGDRLLDHLRAHLDE